MDRKKMIWIGFGVGSFIGSYIPMLWGAGFISFSSIFLSALGGVIGIWAGVRMSQ